MFLLLAACASGPDDARAYAEALARVSGAPGEAARACAAVRAPDLRADCLAAGAEALAAADPEAAHALCRAAPAGPGRDECFFQVAERADRPALCAEAGRFARDCRVHAYSRRAEALAAAGATPGTAEEAAAAAARELGLDPEADDAPWWALYRALLARTRPLDLGACDRAPDDRRRTLCRAAGLQLYGDRLNRARDTSGFPCDRADDALPGPLAFVPDPELSALLARRRAEDLCPAGR